MYPCTLSCACVVIMWHEATYSCFKTGLCEIAKDIGILDLQLHSNQRMRGSNQRRDVWDCHVELTENCTTPQRKITQGTNGRLVRLSFSLFFLGARFFFFSYYILLLNLFDITKSFLFTLCPFSTSQLYLDITLLSFPLLPFWIPLPRPRNEEYKNERFYDGVEMSIFAFSSSFNLFWILYLPSYG